MSRLVAALLLSLLVAVPAAQSATYVIPDDGSDIVGSIASVAATFDDTLIDIARRHGLGYEDIVRANPDVDVWVPGEGTNVVLPTRYVLPPGARQGIVLNLAEYRLYYFPPQDAGEPAKVMTFPISIGRMDWETPIGLTTVISKVTNPAWYPPQSVRDEHAADGRKLDKIVLPGPDNPLGKHAMRLGLPGYLIHGTNRPAGVGMRVTHGCLRMFPEDIEYLFGFVRLNTPVRIINEPVKIGWDLNELVIEAHPVLASAPQQTTDEPQRSSATVNDDEAADNTADSMVNSAVDGLPQNESHAAANQDSAGAVTGDNGDADDVAAAISKDPLTSAAEQFIVATGERPGQLDWLLVEEAVLRADGLPVAVGEAIKNAATSAASE